ncbi:MAG TPA: HIT family protein [Candidatus Bathyarchaeia archaeon]|nr:HIT family protein [Candidatus Bathyarchaeia archaeon]
MKQTKKSLLSTHDNKRQVAHGLEDDCWICQRLSEPRHLVVCETRTSVTKLNPDQFFQGYTFVTLKWHAEELFELEDRDRKHFLEDMSKVSAAIARALKSDKMNYELLGNGMPHLHWHLVPRYRSDPFWGRPIWSGARKRKRLARDEYTSIIEQIRSELPRK